MIIAYVIWSVCAIVFLIIGISTFNNKEASGFFTFVKPPEVTDIKAYNKAVAILWIVSAVLFEIIGIPILFMEQNDPRSLVMVVATVILLIGMMIVYTRIEAKYRK